MAVPAETLFFLRLLLLAVVAVGKEAPLFQTQGWPGGLEAGGMLEVALAALAVREIPLVHHHLKGIMVEQEEIELPITTYKPVVAAGQVL